MVEQRKRGADLRSAGSGRLCLPELLLPSESCLMSAPGFKPERLTDISPG